jgi:hypothetical protein
LNKLDILIAPADKNLGFVILDTVIYKQAISNFLGDSKTYLIIQPKEFDKLNCIALAECWKFTKLLKKFHFLDSQQMYLLDIAVERTKVTNRTMYGLPKVHKEPKTWAIPFLIPKIRPIIAGVNSHTYFFEKVLTSILQPIAENLKYTLNSSLQLKSLLMNIENYSNLLLFTLDVESLYPSIPIQEGIDIVSNRIKEWYEKRYNPLLIESMIGILTILLKNNTLQFDNKCYLQICGTAMGMAFAPAYANIYMDNVDRVANNHQLSPLLYVRYLDDILCVYQHTEAEFTDYYNFLNNINPAIKFTVECLSKKVNYLDLTIDINNQLPKFSLFQKNTIINNMVDFSSNHSIDTLLATIQGFIFKIYNYNNDSSLIKLQLDNLAKKLEDKNYPGYVFNTQLKKVQDRLMIDSKNNKIVGKIKCCNECKYCVSISEANTSHCKLHHYLLITQNYNCKVSNFTFIAQCKLCNIKIISHYHESFRKLMANSIKNLNANLEFHQLNKHWRSHDENIKLNLSNFYKVYQFHIVKHFSLKNKLDLTFYNKLRNGNDNNENYIWNNLKVNNFDKAHYITHSPEIERIILTIKKKYNIKNISTYSNYKNQLKNILTRKLKKV